MSKWIRPTPAEADEMRRAQTLARQAEQRLEAERRRAARLGLQANVTANSATNFFTGFTENISQGGVFIATYSPPPVGEVVALRISVEGQGELIVEGEVRWIRTDDRGEPEGCGVKFQHLDERQQRALQAMIRLAEQDPLFFES